MPTLFVLFSVHKILTQTCPSKAPLVHNRLGGIEMPYSNGQGMISLGNLENPKGVGDHWNPIGHSEAELARIARTFATFSL